MESSTTSSIISALGGGSGVDMTKLASDLAEARFLPQIGQLESRSETLEAKISAASTLKNQLSQLSSALGDRIRNGDLAPTATLGNEDVADVSVLSGSRATGSYSLEVTQLASAQTLASKSFGAASDLVGEGQLTIRFGTISGTSFAEDPASTAAVIDVTASDTLSSLADKIRGSGSGLTAYVANTASGAKLVVKGVDGADKAFVIEASGASVAGTGNGGGGGNGNGNGNGNGGGNGGGGGGPVAAPGNLDYLAWNPATDAGERTASAADAQFRFDGVEMTSSTNKVTGLPGGLVLSLKATNTGAPTTIGFEEKSSEITAMMGDFVAALNDIASTLAELASPKGGDLGNDPGARALKRALANLSTQVVMPNAASGEPSTLADLGLARTREGAFRLDSQRLQDTLSNNLPAASAMFTTGLFGVFASVDKMAREMGASSNPGTLGGSITRYTSQLERVDDRLAEIAEQQEDLRTRMVKQFAAVDRNVAASQSTLSFLKNQIAAWNGDNN